MANSYIRDLSAMSGDQTQTTDTSAYSKFNLALMKLLKQQQSMGTSQFTNAEQQGVQEQSNRIMATPPQGLVGANPALQNQVRTAQASAMNPTIEGASKLGQTFGEQLGSLGNAIEQARLIGATMQQEETTKRQEAIDMIYKFPTAVKTLDDKTKKSIAQRAGVPIEFIDSLPDEETTANDQWVDEKLSDGSLAQRNKKTGELKVIQKASDTGSNISDEYTSTKKQRIIDSVDELIGRVNNKTSGAGSYLAWMKGTEAYNFRSELDTLKSNIATSELQEMRSASKTGGALGQVAVQELMLLEASLGALDQGQSPDNLKKNLQKIKDTIKRWQAAKSSTTNVSENTSEDDPLGIK